MTRINSAIKPHRLTDQHLIAELRELPRVFTSVQKRISDGKNFEDIPEKFTLGSGHVKFFYDKLSFLNNRYAELAYEYTCRYDKGWEWVINIDRFPDFLCNWYSPTQFEKDILIERISKRIMESKQIPKYYRRSISKEEAINKLLK